MCEEDIDTFSEGLRKNMKWVENNSWIKNDLRYDKKYAIINNEGIYENRGFESEEEARKVSRGLDDSFIIGVNMPVEVSYWPTLFSVNLDKS